MDSMVSSFMKNCFSFYSVFGCDVSGAIGISPIIAPISMEIILFNGFSSGGSVFNHLAGRFL